MEHRWKRGSADGADPRDEHRPEHAEGEADEVDHAVATWPTYADYKQKTDRKIPLFLLERA